MDKTIHMFTLFVETLVTIIAFILISSAPISNAIVIGLLCGFIVFIIVSPLISEHKVKSLCNAFSKFGDSIKHKQG